MRKTTMAFRNEVNLEFLVDLIYLTNKLVFKSVLRNISINSQLVLSPFMLVFIYYLNQVLKFH